MRAGIFVIVVWLFEAFLLPAVKPSLTISPTETPPVIDGVLDEPGWERHRIPTDEWVSYSPVRGGRVEQKTEVAITYDDKNLYLAFRCLDPEPDKIKTSVSRRDDILLRDDWVGMSLDSMHNGQLSYDLFVNPAGIQADMLTSSSSGEDPSPDFVWQSAGRRTSEGYVVEVRLPLQTIRFKSGPEVQMGVTFRRRISRVGSVSWPEIPSGKSIFESQATLVMEGLIQPRTLEVVPSVTYSYNQDLQTPGTWRGDSRPDVGISVKYGITSSIVADVTVNPDFSQVESDAYQVEVNQRYPIFFSEKRLFFMEGMNIFTMAGATGDGNMLTTVHTRKMVDPLWGLKLTGTTGRLTFGTLSAADEAPGRPFEDGQVNPFLGDKKYFNVGRAMYSFGNGNYVGGLVADTELGREHNRVVGSDATFRFGGHHEVTGTVLGTSTLDGNNPDNRSGVGAQATYGYFTDNVTLMSQFEHYDPEFQMDTAFYNRTGISTGWGFARYLFLPESKRFPWLKGIGPVTWNLRGRDRVQGGNERFNMVGMEIRTTRQGFGRIDYAIGREPWVGRTFKTGGLGASGQGQLTRWLNVNGFMRLGNAIFYDPAEPFQGRRRLYNLRLIFQPSSRVSQDVGYNRVRFRRASNNEAVYTVNLINTRTTYQFNKQLSARAIVQYDDSRKQVLGDLLGSYELVPGTVAYLGYGSLYEQQEFRDDVWYPGEGQYLTTRRGLFFKVSYLHRF